MTTNLNEILRNTLDNLTGAEFKRLKHYLRDQGRIAWGKLEKADTDDAVDLVVEVYDTDAGGLVLTILQKMNHHQLAVDLEKDLERYYDKAHATTRKKSSLKQKLQDHLKNRLPTVHQELSDITSQGTYIELYVERSPTGSSSEKKPVELGKMFTETFARRVLTLGTAGIGKTVAVQEFIRGWVNKTTNQDIDFVFLLPFRELNLKMRNNYTLFDLILVYYPELEDLRNLPEFSDCKILFIFDGLNESNLKLEFDDCICDPKEVASVKTLISSLIKGTLLPSALLWVTTRPAAASLVIRECFKLSTELCGFSDAQAIEFFQKTIKNPGKARKVIDYINNNKSLHVICQIPLFCNILASLLEETLEDQSIKEPPKTLTETFVSFSALQIMKMNENVKNTDEMGKRQFLIKLGKLAFTHLWKGTQIFTEKHLKKCDLDVKSEAFNAGVCMKILKMEPAIPGESTYSFVHLSVQKFLAALYVLHESFHGENPLLNTVSEKIRWKSTPSRFHLFEFAVEKALQSQNGHLDLFLCFLLGLAPMLEPKVRPPLDMVLPQAVVRELSIQKTIQYIKEKIKEDITLEQLFNFFHCLNELQDSSLAEEINRYINSEEEEKNLTPAQCSALGYLLLMSAKDLEEFDLRKYLRSEAGLDRMLSVVKISRRVWLNRCCLSKTSCEMLASVVKGTPSCVRELDLSDNDLLDEGVELLSVGLRDPQCKLETLRLIRCHLSNASCDLLEPVLRGTSSLRELDMSGNDLQDEGVEVLCAGLGDPQCKLETLRLNQCNLSKVSCEMIALVLQETPSHIKELDLSENDLGDEGVDLLCVGLWDPQCRLETLRLSFCVITHKGCTFLAAALRSNPSYLKHLDLSCNHPGDSGIRELTERLNDPNCKLQTFRYDNGGEFRTKPGVKKYACELTLDPNTAARTLTFLEGNNGVINVSEKQPYPDHPERFDCSQVLSREGLSGRCYWEAEWSGATVYIGMAYKSIQRKRDVKSSCFGKIDNSWAVRFYESTTVKCKLDPVSKKNFFIDCFMYSAVHNNKTTSIEVPLSSGSNRVGVFLDWPAGTLSFYNVLPDTLTHLHTFHSTFTEPLYAGFGCYWHSNSVSLCQIVRCHNSAGTLNSAENSDVSVQISK